MGEFWLKLLGFDPVRIPPGAQTEFVWTHAPTSAGVFVLLALVAGACYGVYALYRREMATCPPRAKAALAAIRVAIVLSLATVFMGPALAATLRRTIEPYVLLLLDDSLSMSIPDRYEGDAAAKVAGAVGTDPEALRAAPPTRAELVDALLRKDQGKFLRDLQARGRVLVLTFSDKLKIREVLGTRTEAAPAPVEAKGAVDRGDPIPPLEPVGPSTDLARAIRESLASLAGNPVAAIVLITDGQHTSGADPLAAADFAAQNKVPLFTVGVGNPGFPQNLRVSDLWAPETAFAGDPLLIQARVQAEGLAAAPVTVELVERRAGGADAADAPERVVERKEVTIGGDAPQADLTFRHTPAAAGAFVFTVRVPPLPAELIKTDNEKSIAVRVVSEQARVLLVAGGPSWEFQSVRTLLIRDKTINVSCWLQSIDLDMRQDGDTVIEKLPDKPEELFKYDVVMFFDADPAEFNEVWMAALKRFVGEHAGGLFWMAGTKHAIPFISHARTREIRDLLPVRFGDFSFTELRALTEPQARAWRLQVTPAGTDHALLTFDKDPLMNARFWDAVPGVFWSFPSAGPKPGAVTLLEHSDPRLRVKDTARPLLVTGQYGGGRTIYMGFNGTWRWRKLGERAFDRFWVQAVRFLVEGRVAGGKRRGRLATDRDTYPIGGRVAVSAVLYTPSFEPLNLPAVAALARARADAPPVEIELRGVEGRPGQYEGFYQAAQLGVTEIEVTLRDDPQGSPIRITKTFSVETPRVEFADPRLHRALLADLAERSHGRYLGIDEIQRVPELIPDRRETLVVREKPQDLWDTGRLLLLLVALLTVEWAVRKHYRLM
jgi:hypothetical protein